MKLEERTRLVSIVLADHDFSFALELILAKQRIDQGGGEKFHPAFDAVGGHRQVVVDALFARRAVELRTELGCSSDKVIGIRVRGVRLEEHVLVQVREPLELGILCERAVLDVRFDRHERHAAILDDDDVETVRQRPSLDLAFELGTLRGCDRRRADEHSKHSRANRATNSTRARWRHEIIHGFFSLTMSSVDPKLLERLAGRLEAKHVRRNEPLAPLTTFKIGGPADVLFEATSADSLANAVLAARETGVPYFVLGLGANVLIGDRGFRGLVIRNIARAHEFRVDADRPDSCLLWTESGAIVKDLIQESVSKGWSGLEHYVGIPSTIGGAVWQNLHFLSPAPARERTMFIAEIFQSCDILSEESERKTVGAEYVQFGYDDTVFHHRRDIVLSATFKLDARGPGDSASQCFKRISAGAAESTRGSIGIRAPDRSSRRSREWARDDSWISPASRDFAAAARRSRTFTPTSW